ncbi:MAG: hypothetical protein LH472_06860 [Pyrinomonadaceae bacterium]|nr:hypothetical protein [Pyrinomonadaceae bacterium]
MINFESKNKWQIRLATLSIFLLGLAAGAFALNAYNLWRGAAKQPTKQERYQEAFSQLNLTEPQKIEVQKIVAEIRENVQQVRQESEPRMQGIRARNDARLQSVLTAEQWTKFQELRESIRQSEK